MRALIALPLVVAAAGGAAPARGSDVCGKFWPARAVFVGKLIKARPGRSRSYQYDNGAKRFSKTPVLLATFSVERAFTGFTRAAGPVVVEVECAACLSRDRPDPGERFLVYAYGAGPKGGSPLATDALTPVSEAAAAVEYLTQLTAPGTIAYELDRVGAGILSGRALSKPQPAYPEAAKAARASGPVTVAILLDPEGRVTRAEAVCGHPLLRAAAEEAAKKIRYAPTEVSGRRVSMGGLVTYNFVLH